MADASHFPFSDHKSNGNETSIRDANAASLNAGWPDGWFIFRAGRVEGPLSAVDAFSTAQGVDRNVLASRKGFSQWYSLADLAELYTMAEKLGQKTAKAADELKSQLAENLANIEVLRAIVNTGIDPTVINQPTSASFAQTPGAFATSHLSSEMLEQPAAPTMTSVSADAFAGTNTQATPSQAPAIATSDDLYRAYFSAKGRMRLGQLKNPWVSSFLLMPITLLVYWTVWFDEAAREVAWHAEGGSARQFMGPTWLAWIPGVHVYMTYRLAMGVRYMERQNGYQTISPALAALFALVPPFAVAYLQEAMTRHWLLHVREHHLNCAV